MTFDAQAFLSQQVEGANVTQFTPIPAAEYVGIISKIEGKEQPKPDGTGVWTIADITWTIDDARAKEATGLPMPSVRDSLFLDMENGKIATGKNKNVSLGRLREAVGLNDGAFTFSALIGRVAKLQIVVEPDKKDTSPNPKLYNRIKAYGKL